MKEEIKIVVYRKEELSNGRNVPTGEIGVKYTIPKDYFEGRRLMQEGDFITLDEEEMDYLHRVIASINKIGKTQSEILKKENSPINKLEVYVKWHKQQ